MYVIYNILKKGDPKYNIEAMVHTSCFMELEATYPLYGQRSEEGDSVPKY